MRALTATFDEKDPDPQNGDPLPPLWHWLYFLDTAPQSKIGPDGHAERGDFLPPVPLPRRMWAGSRFAFDGEPLRVGETIRRASRIKSVEPKSGSTGSMVFVTVEHTVSGARGTSFIEEHDIVYREAAKPGEKQREPKPAPDRRHLVEERSWPTPCCCSASLPSPSTAIASTTISPMSPALKAIPA